MSEESKGDWRALAAKHEALAANETDSVLVAEHRKLAAAYRALAEQQDWLDGKAPGKD
jgi:hypothetical protein